jgi:hypothetical protein
MRPFLRAVILSLVAGCTGISDMPADEPCKNVGYAVASRTEACLGDGKLANARFTRFQGTYTCTVASPTEQDFTCAVAVNATTCEAVAANGETWDKWLLASPACGTIFRHKDGSPAVPETGDDAVSMNAVCQGISDEAWTQRQRCTNNGVVGDKAAGYAELEAALRCTARWPAGGTPPIATACIAQLDATPCGNVADQKSLVSWVAAAPACSSLLVPR